MINKVTLIGNLGKDPEIRRLESGTSVGKFSLATNESYKDKNGEWQDQTDWHDIVAWRYLAEKAERDFKKGKLVYIEGRLTTRKWQDKDGNNRYTTEVVARTANLLEKKENSGYFPSPNDAPPAYSNNNNGNGNEQKTTNETPVVASTSQPVTADVSATETDASDDLPF